MGPSGKVPDAWDDDWVSKADVSKRKDLYLPLVAHHRTRTLPQLP